MLDASTNVVFEKTKQPAPDAEGSYSRSADRFAEGLVRRAAMNALTSVRGQEARDLQGAGADSCETMSTATRRSRRLQRIPTPTGPRKKPSRCSTAARLHPQDADRGPHLAGRARRAATGRLAGRRCCRRRSGQDVRKELGELGVRVIRLGTLPEQMLFDKERLAVQAGKPVEIVFENNDLMPHNFVVTQPGALEEVGTLGRGDRDAARRARTAIRARLEQVLLRSRLSSRATSQKLSFTAPSKPGVYPYVCTYPGHWRRMFGALYVVADLDEYLADPEGYLAKNPLPIADDLLKFNRPRKEWKSRTSPRRSNAHRTRAARSATASRCSRSPTASPATSSTAWATSSAPT